MKDLELAVHLPRQSWLAAREAAVALERAGADGLVASDHLMYEDGRAALECWTLLTAAATATERVWVQPAVLSQTFRPPALIAKMVATLDQVSGGRVRLGLGAGQDGWEHHALGLEFLGGPDRARQLEEAIRIVRLLWTGEKVSFEGRFHSVRECILRPFPGRPVPIAVGASGDRMLETVAAVADEWNCSARFLDRVAERARRLDELCAAVGRRVRRSLNLPVLAKPQPPGRYHHELAPVGVAAVLERLQELCELGFDAVWLSPHADGGLEVALQVLGEMRGGQAAAGGVLNAQEN